MKVKKGLWESLEKCGCLDAIGPNHVFQSKSAALTAIFQKLDKNVCRHCDKRIFRECASVPREDS
jgi:SulP family sulfate permease